MCSFNITCNYQEIFPVRSYENEDVEESLGTVFLEAMRLGILTGK